MTIRDTVMVKNDASVRTTPRRSELMKRVRRSDTKPERTVRRILWSVGGRYRTNVSDLPGTPDVANKTRGKAVFIHGCFWHHHQGCPRGRLPRRNRPFWREKLLGNKERDARKVRALEDAGFDVLIVWECELVDPKGLEARLKRFWFDRGIENRG